MYDTHMEVGTARHRKTKFKITSDDAAELSEWEYFVAHLNASAVNVPSRQEEIQTPAMAPPTKEIINTSSPAFPLQYYLQQPILRHRRKGKVIQNGEKEPKLTR